MLLDSFAPNPDVVETHSIDIAASREVFYQGLWTTDIGGSIVIKLLLALRSLPEFVLHGSRPRNSEVNLQTLIDSGFGVLAEKPGEEVVLGVTGRFWRPTGNLSPFRREDFDQPMPPESFRGVWNFSVCEGLNELSILSTETQFQSGDVAS